MGIDRYIAVTYPTTYRYYQQTSLRYLAVQMIFPFFYTVFFLTFGFLERDTQEQITCANPLALKGASFQWYNYTCAFIYVAIFFTYFRVYFLLKSNKTSSRFKSVFRSILVTVGFVLLGWATTTIANASSYSVTDDLKTAHLIQTYAGITVNFAAASNVFVFYSIKRFRSPCHLLICATCVADLLHVCGQFPFCVHLFGNLTSSQAQCFYILTIPIVGFTTGGPLILSMGIDRLIAVKFPTKYRYYQEEPRNYVIAQLAFPIIYSVVFLVYGFLVRDTDVKNQLICSNPLSLNGNAFQMFTYSSGVIYIAVFFIYLSVYVMLKSNKASARFKNVFRSILVTVGFVLLGWVTTTTANTLSYSITTDLLTIQLIQMYAGITVNFAAASNVFVFYAINSEYRSVIKSMFGISTKGGMIFEPSSTQTVTKVAPTRSTSQPSVMFQKSQQAARRMTVV
ncbi:unnamed protein product [Caenorhabditis brenneri]